MSRPQVMIDFTDDGGETWSHEMWFDLVGADKNYLNRIILYRQGSAYDRRYRVRCSENVSFTLVSASANVSIGI